MILLSEISVDEQVVSSTNQRYNYCRLIVDGCFNSQNSSQFLRLFQTRILLLQEFRPCIGQKQ